MHLKKKAPTAIEGAFLMQVQRLFTNQPMSQVISTGMGSTFQMSRQ